MNIIIALLPAIGWGVMPWIVNKVPNSKPANQIFGVGMGATIVGIIVTLIQHPAISMPVFFLSLLSGALWTIGQIGQFISFTRIGHPDRGQQDHADLNWPAAGRQYYHRGFDLW